MKRDFKYNMPLYLITYGIFRFLIEFIRGDERGSFIGVLTPSQFWSVVMIITGICVFFVMQKNIRSKDDEKIL